MKRAYVIPELELFNVRPDEQIAVSCLWVNNYGDAEWATPENPGGYGSCWWDGSGGGNFPGGEFAAQVTGS